MTDAEGFSLFFTLFSAITALGWLGLLLRAYRLQRNIPPLDRALPEGFFSSAPLPKISVIIPACNEELRIEAALTTVLAQDYPHLEVIVINDRSTDRTADIIARLSESHQKAVPELRILTVTELPSGWLGKNHANHLGALAATGEYFLFTDADIFFAPDTISKTIRYVRQSGARHVVAYPALRWEEYWEEAFLAIFTILFTWKFNPLKARKPARKKDFIGVGAFNFIDRRLYTAFGGHSVLRMEVADDVKLGFYVKQCGEGNHLVNGRTLLSVRWREGLWDSMKGIERSAFPGINFSWMWVWIGIGGTLFGLIAPYYLVVVGLAAELPWVTGLSVLSVAAIVGVYAVGGKRWDKALWLGLTHPLMALCFLYAFVASAVRITRDGGVRWRETFYPIDVLKSNVDPTSAPSYHS